MSSCEDPPACHRLLLLWPIPNGWNASEKCNMISIFMVFKSSMICGIHRTFRGVWLLIHAGIQAELCSKRNPGTWLWSPPTDFKSNGSPKFGIWPRFYSFRSITPVSIHRCLWNCAQTSRLALLFSIVILSVSMPQRKLDGERLSNPPEFPCSMKNLYFFKRQN